MVHEAWSSIERNSSVPTDEFHILPVVDDVKITQLPVSDLDTPPVRCRRTRIARNFDDDSRKQLIKPQNGNRRQRNDRFFDDVKVIHLKRRFEVFSYLCCMSNFQL